MNCAWLRSSAQWQLVPSVSEAELTYLTEGRQEFEHEVAEDIKIVICS